MRRPIIAGNWKMHLTIPESLALVEAVKHTVERDAVEVVVCPPFTALWAVAQDLRGSAIGLGAQDLFWEPQGAFTGEIAATMLTDVGCSFVIIGHSERRRHFGETDEMVHRKLRAALGQGLIPIVCIGETLQERSAQRTMNVLTTQLAGALGACSPAECAKVILAYEPVWAIGTGQNATPEQAQEAHQTIRQWLSGHAGASVAQAVRIQYGGSVTASNASSLLQQADVDGALVGGASLNADSFVAIVKSAVQARQ